MFLLVSCSTEQERYLLILSGQVEDETKFVLFGKDTIRINEGNFIDTLKLQENYYDYIQLSNWKWPKLIYVEKGGKLEIDFTNKIAAKNDVINTFLLNIDSLLIPYTLSWSMEEEIFRKTLKSELDTNFQRIDDYFLNQSILENQIIELKQIEKLKVAHRTANFISFQEKNGLIIDRDIYDFVQDVDLNNIRLEKQINNRNFQYYYLLDKVSVELPDSIYPFAAIDTVNKYSNVESIRKMIISSIVKAGFYDENVNHEELMASYKTNFGELKKDDKLLNIYSRINALKPKNDAPDFGELEDKNGKYVSLEDLRGSNILITVWGTWCPYCKEELPFLQKLRNKYVDKIQFVGISLDTDKVKWIEYIEQNNWGGLHLIDSERNSTFKSNYLINGTNIHILIDREGRIISSRGMKPSTNGLEDMIKQLN